MMTEQERLLKNIMEYEFAANEIVLFLNTNPFNKKAISLHKTVTDKLKELTKKYETEFSALTSKNVRSENEWTWALDPWPWDN